MVWMSHPDAGPAQFPAAAVEAWQSMGWAPCDPPPQVDPALVEYQPAAAPAAPTEDQAETGDENESEEPTDG